MSKPRYARFYKCDLQMQTPIDRRHWVGKPLPQTATSAELQQAASEYIARCYEVRLEVIAITDHNLGSDQGIEFIGKLVEQSEVQGAQNGYQIVVFPGFELEVKVPGRCHLLCLFPPESDLSEVDHRLSELGLPKGKRFKEGKPVPSDKDLDEVLALVSPPAGIVIAAHADGSKGVLDEKQMAECWHQDLLRNEDLLCIELHQPREHYESSSGKLGMIVRNDRGDWHRSHPVAVVNSSDCKRLRESDGSGDTSWIDKRFTWIKMGEPSIEGLRQAFLDHESRIRFGETRPETLQTYPRIERMKVTGTKFLGDQEITFSPNLTTLIGGGGTGKSTIIEYLRAALSEPPASAADVLDNHRRALQSLGSGRVEYLLRQGNETIDVEYSLAGTKAVASSGEVQDVAARFPVLVLSQREVFAIADSGQATLRVLDQLQRDRLEELRRRSQSLQARLSTLDQSLAREVELEQRRDKLSDELARQQSELDLRESQQAPLAHRNLLRRERAAVEAVDEAVTRAADVTEQFADDLALGIGRSGYRSPDTPHADAIDVLVERAQGYVDQLAQAVRDAAGELRAALAREQGAQERGEWWAALDEAEQAYKAIIPGADDAGGGDDVDGLRVGIERRRDELGALEQELRELQAMAASRAEQLGQLRQVWADEVCARREFAERSAELVPKTEKRSPFVSVAIEPFADQEALVAALDAIDHRSVSTDEIKELCVKLAKVAGDQNPLETFIAGIEQADVGDLPSWSKQLRPAAWQAIVRHFDARRRRALELVRIPDRAVVTLRRMDGREAGRLDSGLSVGQRCTAVLALVLSAGAQQPIVIDQPEDEIDNEFIYRELVPLLRQAKLDRQVILATHNPNLPVNGDAELIYPLQARASSTRPSAEVRGVPWKTAGGTTAVGSLDRQSVKEAVEEIMEGSEDAFRRRLARYGF